MRLILHVSTSWRNEEVRKKQSNLCDVIWWDSRKSVWAGRNWYRKPIGFWLNYSAAPLYQTYWLGVSCCVLIRVLMNTTFNAAADEVKVIWSLQLARFLHLLGQAFIAEYQWISWNNRHEGRNNFSLEMVCFHVCIAPCQLQSFDRSTRCRPTKRTQYPHHPQRHLIRSPGTNVTSHL